MGVGEAGYPVAGGVEQDRVASVGCFDSQANSEMGLPDAWRAEQHNVLRLGDVGAGSEMREDIAPQAGHAPASVPHSACSPGSTTSRPRSPTSPKPMSTAG